MPAARARGDVLKRQASNKPRCGSVVHAAAIQDRDGGGKGAIAHKQIVKRSNDMKGFVVLPRGRERTFFRNPTLKGPSPAGAASRD
jgi:hypothetical protein